MVTDWNKIQNIVLLQNGEICITAFHARTPSTKAYKTSFDATCVASKNPELFFFTKDATCFARMPYDYTILVYKLKASTPTKNMFYFSTINAKEKYM